jgi:hypothetical protein
VDSETVDARATVIYSGLRAASDDEVGASSISEMFGGDCPGTLTPGSGYSSPCFFGDYVYGAFSDKRSSDKRLRFFTPYTGQALTSGVTDIHVVGTTIDVTP